MRYDNIAQILHVLGLEKEGHRAQNALGLMDLAREGLPPTVLSRLQEQFNTTEVKLFEMMGLAKRTGFRIISERQRLGLGPSDTVLRLASLLCLARTRFKTDEEARYWFFMPQVALAGQAATDLVRYDVGARLVDEILERLPPVPRP